MFAFLGKLLPVKGKEEGGCCGGKSAKAEKETGCCGGGQHAQAHEEEDNTSPKGGCCGGGCH